MGTVIDPEVEAVGTVDSPNVPSSRTRAIAAGAHADAAFAGLQARRTTATAVAGSDALAAAKARVAELLSYENAALEDDLASALDQTTGASPTTTAPSSPMSSPRPQPSAGSARPCRDAETVTTVSGSRVEVTMSAPGKPGRSSA